MSDSPKIEPTHEQQLLNVLETISDQQAQISQQLADLLEILTTQPETSLIEQLSELLQPLLTDVKEIKQKVKHLPDPTTATTPGAAIAS